MVNLEHNITVDDLIVEYMIIRLNNGYNPEFKSSEFVEFLKYFLNKSNIEIHDVIFDNNKLFKRFYDRKSEYDWNEYAHIDMKYIDEYIIRPNYRFSMYDRSVINTYFIYDERVGVLRNIIVDYLNCIEKKRRIDENIKPNIIEIDVGKYYAAKALEKSFDIYVQEEIKNNKWPRQCTDIEKYLLKKDLAPIIELKSIRKEIIEFYKKLSKYISILYNEDKKLQINMADNHYLARANYKLLIDSSEIIKNYFKKYECYSEDLTKSLDNKNIKRIVKTIDDKKL